MKRILFILAALFATAQSQTIQTIGAPTTTVVSRGNFRTDSIFYLPKRQKLPTDSGAVRYQISDSSVYYWTGSNWRRLGVHIDTASMLNPYLRGSGTANYFPKFDASRSVINSKLYESGTNLLFNTTTASFTSTGISTIEANNTSASVFALKVLDTTRSYIASNSSNTMDINNLRAGDIRFYTSATLRGRFQTDGTFRLNSLTGTGSRIVTADADGVLSATSSATGLVDTLVLSTRAWRQKGIDSVNANVALKVNISDTASMLTNYIRHAGNGLTKSGQALSVDTASIATRARVQKGIDSVATLASAGVTSVATGYGLSGGTITTTGTIIADTLQLSTRAWRQKGLDSLAALEISGSGTTNYVPKFTDTRTVGNSQIFDNGTSVGIGVASPGAILDISAIVGFVRLTSSTGTNRSFYQAINGGAALNIGVENSTGNGLLTTAGAYGSVITNYSLHPLVFGTNSTERGRFTSAGELLLNTTTDAGDYKLQVSGNSYISGNLGIGGAATSVLHVNGGSTPQFGATALINADIETNNSVYNGTLSLQNTSTPAGDASIRFGVYGHAIIRSQNETSDFGGRLDFYTRPSDANTPTIKMTINTLGRVGIGTTSPQELFHVAGNQRITGDYFQGYGSASAYRMEIGTGRTGNGAAYIDLVGDETNSDFGLRLIRNSGGANTSSSLAHRGTGELNIYNYDAAPIIFVISSAEIGRWNPGGELLLNNAGTDAGDYKLQVSGNAYVTGTTVLAATSGNVGVGTASPNYKFVVEGTGYPLSRYTSTFASGGITYTSVLLGNVAVNEGTSIGHAYNSGTAANSFFHITPYGTSEGSTFAVRPNGNIGIGTSSPSATALLEVSSTTKGFLPPRMTTTQRDAISSPAAGLVIYNTTTSKLQVYTTSWTDLH